MAAKSAPTPIPSRGPRRPQPAARRRQLLDTAARLLTEQGAARLEIMEVARLAGVSRPVVYRLFPSRLALIEGVLADLQADLAGRFQGALVATMGAPLPQVIAAFVDAC